MVILALQKFKLPPSASRWKRKFYYFLRNKLKLPGENSLIFSTHYLQFPRTYETIVYWFVLCDDLLDIILMGLFSLSLKMWVIITLWFILAPIAHRWDLGPIFVSHLHLQCLDSWNVACFRNAIGYAFMRHLVYIDILFTSFDGVLRYYEFQILGTGFSIILLNLGKRQPGDVRYIHF